MLVKRRLSRSASPLITRTKAPMGILVSDISAPRSPVTMFSPTLNPGVVFTHEEQRQLGLTGRLPPTMLTLEQQADRVWIQLQSFATYLGRILLLRQPRYRHELFYCKVLANTYPDPARRCRCPTKAVPGISAIGMLVASKSRWANRRPTPPAME